MLSPLYFITQPSSRYSQAEMVEMACRGGLRLVQMRLKECSEEEQYRIGLEIKAVCGKYAATFIVNDNVRLAKDLDADGVHLGMNDMSAAEARSILGTSKIIGGTANTFERIEELLPYVDYVGLGPYRYTETKKNLSPILGLKGYERIFDQLKAQGISLPVYAIGGIIANDFPDLMRLGFAGIAVSGIIASAPDIQDTTRRLSEMLDLIHS